MNEIFDAGLITLGALGVSIFSKKALNDGLNVPRTMSEVLKLMIAVGGGSLVIHDL